jgi:hypothetical protein
MARKSKKGPREVEIVTGRRKNHFSGRGGGDTVFWIKYLAIYIKLFYYICII